VRGSDAAALPGAALVRHFARAFRNPFILRVLVARAHPCLPPASPLPMAGDTNPRHLDYHKHHNQLHRSRCRIVFEDRPGGDIVYKLDTKADVEALKSNPFVLKEKCMYRLQISFRVQHEIVSGLKFTNKVHSAKTTPFRLKIQGPGPWPKSASHVPYTLIQTPVDHLYLDQPKILATGLNLRWMQTTR
jgi:hypothetical protein